MANKMDGGPLEKLSKIEDVVLNQYRGTSSIPSSNATKLSIPKENIHVAVVVRLERPKDVESEKRQKLASDVKNAVETLLQRTFKGDRMAGYQLKVYVVLASEGSSIARFWAAEFGRGHVKECLAWILTKGGDETVRYGREKVTDSGSCGFADLCSNTYGEDALIGKLADKLVHQIIRKIN